MNTLSMLLGNIRGTIGETSVVAIMIGAMFLILMGVIDLRIPGTYIVTFVIFITLFGGHGFDPQYITAHLCGGGLMLGNRLCNISDHEQRKDPFWNLSWMSDGSVPSFWWISRRSFLCDHHQ